MIQLFARNHSGSLEYSWDSNARLKAGPHCSPVPSTQPFCQKNICTLPFCALSTDVKVFNIWTHLSTCYSSPRITVTTPLLPRDL